jgi:hypothetical protein
MNFRVLIVHDFSAMIAAAEGHDLNVHLAASTSTLLQ